MWNHVNKLTEKCCEVCGSLYDGTINSKRCSEFCKKQWLQDYYKNKKPNNLNNFSIPRVCIICNKQYLINGNKQKTCSNNCYNQNVRAEERKKYHKNRESITSKKREQEKLRNIKKYPNFISQIRLPLLKDEDKEFFKPLDLILTDELKTKEKNKRRKHRRDNDLSYKLKNNISRSMRSYLINNSNGSKLDFLTYTINDLKNHLEYQFESWMTWDNWGIYKNDGIRKWHVDHIIPQSIFNFINDDNSMNLREIEACWALNNLRPLCALENIKKGNKNAM